MGGTVSTYVSPFTDDYYYFLDEETGLKLVSDEAVGEKTSKMPERNNIPPPSYLDLSAAKRKLTVGK